MSTVAIVSERFVRSENLARQGLDLLAAHKIIRDAFDAQLVWWVYIWPFGIHRIRRLDKLLRVGQYLVDQIDELAKESRSLRGPL